MHLRKSQFTMSNAFSKLALILTDSVRAFEPQLIISLAVAKESKIGLPLRKAVCPGEMILSIARSNLLARTLEIILLDAVNKADRPEVVNSFGSLLFGDKAEIRVIQGASGQGSIEEVREDVVEVGFDHLPEFVKEVHAEPVWSRRFVALKVEGCLLDLFRCEGGCKVRVV